MHEKSRFYARYFTYTVLDLCGYFAYIGIMLIPAAGYDSYTYRIGRGKVEKRENECRERLNDNALI